MYEPYIQLIRTCFPNAKIITDRFHIVQHINRALNSARVTVMKENSKYYARLKRYWKLLLKGSSKLDLSNYRTFVGYKHKMTESMVVSDLIAQDKILFETYWLSQYLKQAISNKNTSEFERLILLKHENISPQMEVALKTFRKKKDYIYNALIFPFSNGKLEGTNNLIKAIKRIAFGFRNFYHFRARILLITNTMIKLEY